MYMKLSEANLTQSKRNRRDGDPVVYRRTLCGEVVFALDNNPAKLSDPGERYGTLYEAHDELWIVPDEWNDDDAMQARQAISDDE